MRILEVPSCCWANPRQRPSSSDTAAAGLRRASAPIPPNRRPHAASRAGAFAWAISLRTSRSTRPPTCSRKCWSSMIASASRSSGTPWTRRLEPDARAHSQCRRTFRRCRMGSRRRGCGPDARRRARCARRSEGPHRRASTRRHGEASLRGASDVARLSRDDGRAVHRLHHCGSPRRSARCRGPLFRARAAHAALLSGERPQARDRKAAHARGGRPPRKRLRFLLLQSVREDHARRFRTLDKPAAAGRGERSVACGRQ